MSTFEPQNQQWATQQPTTQQGMAPGSSVGADLSESFKWSFSALGKHWKALFIPSIIWGLIMIALGIGAFTSILAASIAAGEASYETGVGAGIGGMLIATLLGLLMVLVGVFWTSGVAGAAAKIAAGHTPTIKDGMFNVKALVVGVVVALLAIISSIVIVGPLVVMFFFSYAIYAAVCDNLGVVDALKVSARAALAKPLHTLAILVINYLISAILGTIVIGVFLALPLTSLLLTVMYVRINGRIPAEPVAS